MKSLNNKIYSMLRSSERFFKADMVYVAKGNFWGVLGQIATALLSLGLTMVFANYLPKETYGTYRYVLSLTGLLSIFTLTGMNQAVGQAVAVGNDGALRESVRYQLKWNSLQLIAFWGLGAYYLYNENLTMAFSLLIMGVSAPLTAALNTFGSYLDGKREFRLNNIFSIISVAVYVTTMSVVTILNGQVIWLIFIYSLATLSTTFLFYIVTLRKFKPPAKESGDALKYGRKLTLIGLIGPFVSQIDKIILAHFWGATSLAIYSLATVIPDRASISVKGLVGIGMPKFSTKTPEEINKVFYLRIFQGLVIGSFFMVAYVVLAPYLFTYLLPKYLDALFYSQLLSLNLIFGMPNRYINLLFASQKLSKLIFVNSFIQNLMRLGLFVILGIWGGILGLITAQVTFSFLAMLINIGMWKSGRKYL